MNRIAVLSDIHGNLPALEAVLRDVGQAQPDLIVVNGDLADGPFPRQTLELLDGLGSRAVWLRGNGDRWVGEAAAGTFTHPDTQTRDLIEWSARQIPEGHLKRLANLPLAHHVNLASLGLIDICHATARDDNEMFLVDSSFEHAEAAFADLTSGIVVLGHCHMPFDRLFNRRRIVNAGSVGMPYGHTGAAWALLGPDIVLRRAVYDIEAASDRILTSGMPGAAEFVDAYVRQVPSDQEAVAVFAATRRTQGKTRGSA